MAMILTGKRYYDFENEKKQRFQGLKLHCVQRNMAQDQGYLTELLGVGSSSPIYPLADSLKFGSVITPVYDKYGRVTDIVLVEEQKDIHLKF